MIAGGSVFAPANVEQPLRQVNLVPAQRRKLAHAERMAVGDQNHGGVAMAVPPNALSGPDQLLDLGWRQKFPAPTISIPRFSGRIARTFPKTSIGGLESDFDNAPVFNRLRTRTFPNRGIFGNDHICAVVGWDCFLAVGAG